MTDLEGYAEDTSAPLVLLLLDQLLLPTATNSHATPERLRYEHAASHLGTAVGLARWIRALPKIVGKRGELGIPNELLARHSLSTEQVYRGEQRDALSSVVYEIAQASHRHLDKCRELLLDGYVDTRRAVTRCFLGAIWVERFLRRLECSANYDIFGGGRGSAVGMPDGLLPFVVFYRVFLQRRPWSTPNKR